MVRLIYIIAKKYQFHQMSYEIINLKWDGIKIPYTVYNSLSPSMHQGDWPSMDKSSCSGHVPQ